MPSGDKIPGMSNNPRPLTTEEFMELDDVKQVELLEQEQALWNRLQMSTQFVPHDIFNMDSMLIATVQFLKEFLGEEAAARMNQHYRTVIYTKMTAIRRDHMKSPIIVPKNGPAI